MNKRNNLLRHSWQGYFIFFLMNALFVVPVLAELERRPAISGWLGVKEIYSTPQGAADEKCGLNLAFVRAEILDVQDFSASYLCFVTTSFPPNFEGHNGPRNLSYHSTCNPGWASGADKTCVRTSGDDPSKKNKCPTVANPIHPLTGFKRESEVDYTSGVISPLMFERHYSSHINMRRLKGVLGGGVWQHTYNTYIQPGGFGLGVVSGGSSCGRASGGHGDWVKEKNEFDVTYWVGGGGCAAGTPVIDLDYVYVHQPDGSSVYFYFDSPTALVGDADSDIKERLEKKVDGSGALLSWMYYTANDEAYEYANDGRLLKVVSRNGQSVDLAYDVVSPIGDDDDKTLDTITDNDGRTITLNYTVINGESRLSSMIDPDNRLFQYTYSADDMLETVTFPIDGGATAPIRTYLYEEVDVKLFWALTGIIDERGVRYVTWDYDDKGRAISSEHGVSGSLIDKVSIDYTNATDNTDRRVAVTNALSQQTIYHYALKQGVKKVHRVERLDHMNANDNSVSCGASDQYTTYDTNGFRDIVFDWEGNAVDYDYNSRGLEERRIEGLIADTSGATPVVFDPQPPGSPARTILTDWHPDFRLATRVQEPDQVTITTYDCDTRRVTGRSVYAPPGPAFIDPTCS